MGLEITLEITSPRPRVACSPDGASQALLDCFLTQNSLPAKVAHLDPDRGVFRRERNLYSDRYRGLGGEMF